MFVKCSNTDCNVCIILLLYCMHLLYVKEINTCLDRKKSGMAALYATIGTCSLIVHLNNILLVTSNTCLTCLFEGKKTELFFKGGHCSIGMLAI